MITAHRDRRLQVLLDFGCDCLRSSLGSSATNVQRQVEHPDALDVSSRQSGPGRCFGAGGGCRTRPGRRDSSRKGVVAMAPACRPMRGSLGATPSPCARSVAGRGARLRTTRSTRGTCQKVNWKEDHDRVERLVSVDVGPDIPPHGEQWVKTGSRTSRAVERRHRSFRKPSPGDVTGADRWHRSSPEGAGRCVWNPGLPARESSGSAAIPWSLDVQRPDGSSSN